MMATSPPSEAFLRQLRLAEVALVEAMSAWETKLHALDTHANAELRAYHRGLIHGFQLGAPGWRALTERRKRRRAAATAATAAWAAMIDDADALLAAGGVPGLTDNVVSLPRRDPDRES